MNGEQIRFYFELGPYPTIASRIAGGTMQSTRLTLEGAIQNFLDGIHQILALQAGGVELDGALAQQASLQYTQSNIDGLARFWPHFYLDSVPAGTTPEAIAAKYKTDAAAMFSAYGL